MLISNIDVYFQKQGFTKNECAFFLETRSFITVVLAVSLILFFWKRLGERSIRADILKQSPKKLTQSPNPNPNLFRGQVVHYTVNILLAE